MKIVRFIADQSFCFSTKARVPVKLCAEYIRVKECFKWDELYISEEDVKGKAIKIIDIPAASGTSSKNNGEENTTGNFDRKAFSEKFNIKESCENNNNNNNNEIDNHIANKENDKIAAVSLNEFYFDQMNSNKKEGEGHEDDNHKLNKQQSSSSYGNLTVKEEEDSLIIDFNTDVINPFGRKFAEVTKEIKEQSPFRRFETYSVNNK